MKKILLTTLIALFVLQTSALAGNKWLVRDKQGRGWTLYTDGTITKTGTPESKDAYYEYSEKFVREAVKEIALYDQNGNIVVSIYKSTVYDYTDGYVNEEGHIVPVKREPTKTEQKIWEMEFK